MPTAASFPATTSNYSLPLLFSGQAQKEFFANEAFSLIDSLLPKTVLGVQDTPPTTPSTGDVYVVGAGSDEWIGQDNGLAIFLNNSWHFVPATPGMMVFNQDTNQIMLFSSAWASAAEPILPQGGSVVDAEARIMLAEIVDVLKAVGILA